MRDDERRFLKVDLTTGTIETETIPAEEVRAFYGGSALAFKYIADKADLGVDPLDPANPLLFVNGMLTGMAVPAACKVSVCAKSPLTGLWSESTAGGFWGAKLKAAGWSGIMITGRSESPVYLWIDHRKVEIRQAGELWGLDTYATSDAVRAATDGRAEVACIGPAGELQVRLAGVMFGGHDARAAGRTGLGAVMGSKRLKAIAVLGTEHPAVADREALHGAVAEALPAIREGTRLFHDFGTAGGVQAVEASGDLPIKNWRLGSWTEGAARICGQAMAETIVSGHYACHACPIRCGKLVRVEKGPHAGTVAHGPEYETCAGFGSMVLNDDRDFLAAANDLCNRYGLDTISVGSAVAFAMEAYERGILTAADNGGLPLEWGSGPAILGLIEDIARRRGIGELLGQGVRRAAEWLGKGAREFAVEVKGLEVAFHDPRAFHSLGVNYATGGRGGCHLEGLTHFVEGGAFPADLLGLPAPVRHSHQGQAAVAVRMQDLMAAFNALGLCKFLGRGKVGPQILARWTGAAVGWELTVEDLMTAGERSFNLRRLVNLPLGIGREADRLPGRLLSHDRGTGGAAGSLPNLGLMLAEYYAIRGWSEEGYPRRQTLTRLGLDRYASLLPYREVEGR